MGEKWYLLRDLEIYDGKGGDPVTGSVLIGDGRIRAIGHIDEAHIPPTTQHFDARGLSAAPGFVNIHSHSDTAILVNPNAENLLLQGITTEVGGNCGFSACFPKSWEDSRWEALATQGLKESWNDVRSYLQKVEQAEPAVNYATLIGHGSIRQAVTQEPGEMLCKEQKEKMRMIAEEAFCQGAWGISSGLESIPGCFADTNELVDLTKTAAEHDLIHSCHLRNEGNSFLDAVEEAIEVSERSGARLEVSHMKVCGQLNWGKMSSALDRIDAARKRGINVSADFYPYLATSTTLTVILPNWALQEGYEGAKRLLDDADTRSKIARHAQHHTMVHGGWSKIVVTGVDNDEYRHLQGKSIAQVSTEMGCSPVECALDLLQEADMNVRVARFAVSEEDLRDLMSHPESNVVTDGTTMLKSHLDSLPHPRNFGGFPRFIAHYCRDEQVVSIAEGIRKMTSLPASKIGLPDRGTLQEGVPADMVLFDVQRLSDQSTYSEPHRSPEGIFAVFVNGSPAVWEGELTGCRSGVVLRQQ